MRKNGVIITKKRPVCDGTLFFCLIRLDLADVESVRALRAVADLKRNLVPLAELVERNVLELVGMEEQVLRTVRCPVDFDEAEALLVLLDYCTVLHTADRYCVTNVSSQ